jgi:hypothetical protein
VAAPLLPDPAWDVVDRARSPIANGTGIGLLGDCNLLQGEDRLIDIV